MLCIIKGRGGHARAQGATNLLLLVLLGSALSAGLLLALPLLEESLRGEDVLAGRDGPVERNQISTQSAYRRYGTERRCENCSLSDILRFG